MEDNKFELIDEELKKVSGGFRPEDLEYLTEEEKKRWEELSTRAYQLHQGLPNTQQEFDIAFKEMQAYHFELLDKIHRLKPMNLNQ